MVKHIRILIIMSSCYFNSFSSVAGSFGIPHPNDPFLNAARNNNDSIDQDDSQNNSAAG